jgi:hypothetical protein
MSFFVTIAVDNATSMGMGTGKISRFALAETIVKRVIRDTLDIHSHSLGWGTSNVRQDFVIDVTLLREVVSGVTLAYYRATHDSYSLYKFPLVTREIRGSAMLDRLIEQPQTDRTRSHTILFTDGETFDAATKEAFAARLRMRAWPVFNTFTIVVCDNTRGARWLRKLRTIPGVAVVYVDTHDVIPYRSIVRNISHLPGSPSRWTRFKAVARSVWMPFKEWFTT